jgi:thiamine-monophosphate kinase
VNKNKLCLRCNALPGERLYCTGRFGKSFITGHHFNFIPRLREAAFIAGKFTRCIIDVSDGLLIDAARVAEMSGTGLELDAASIPSRAGAVFKEKLYDGEDYELLFSVPESKAGQLEQEWPFKDTALTCIGTFTSSPENGITDITTGESLEVSGFDHLTH